MPYLSPTTLTTAEQKLILRVTSKHQRDHLIISLALGTGLRLGEIVGRVLTVSVHESSTGPVVP
ncbi:MAG: hypothetical protein O7A98_02335 [Acidobacteria bacterium]|nr:hypothetical protein [Acidobacteriota bacterium]